MIKVGFSIGRNRSRVYLKRRSRFWLGLLALIALIFAAVVFMSRSPFFVVANVSFAWPGSDAAWPDVENLIRSQLRERKIWQSPEAAAAALSAFPGLEKVEIKQIWPRDVRVFLWRKEPVVAWRLSQDKDFFDKVNQAASGATSSARLRLANLFERLSASSQSSSAVYLVDHSGQIFERRNFVLETLLPEIVSDSRPPKLGDFLPERGQNLLRFARVFAEAGWASYGGRLVYLLSLDEADLVFLEKKTSLLLPIERGGRESFGALGLILKKYAIEGKSLKYVDLRFKNPVVQY